VHAASVAAVRTLILTSSGSQTNFSNRSAMFSSRTLTPNHLPSAESVACFYLNLLRISVESNPELSARVLGITSKALANPFTTN